MLPNLKRLRKEYGVSQQLLADVLGISQQSVNQYENQATEPDLAVLSQMADYFNTSIDFIAGRTDERKVDEQLHALGLSTDEAKLLSQYRSLKPNEKLCVRSLMQIITDK